MSSLKDWEEQTSPPGTSPPGVHVASSHFSKSRASSGNKGCLEEEDEEEGREWSSFTGSLNSSYP